MCVCMERDVILCIEENKTRDRINRDRYRNGRG